MRLLSSSVGLNSSLDAVEATLLRELAAPTTTSKVYCETRNRSSRQSSTFRAIVFARSVLGDSLVCEHVLIFPVYNVASLGCLPSSRLPLGPRYTFFALAKIESII